ncbi:MAG TPA: twin-arginine translocase TatA/TatE family subunit [Acidobacteriaceae bacterium]|jgi:sec-independent protein translocase protein TatB|nr:twin-arginine translocase TatA/TatE family subunit [Acidobacteriaceae bacterium]
MHFGDSIFIFLLALVLFGPKKLPEIGRQVGKLLAEFRRASNEFKFQIQEEMRNLEEDERRKKVVDREAQAKGAEPAALPAETAAAGPTILPPSTGAPVSTSFGYSYPGPAEPATEDASGSTEVQADPSAPADLAVAPEVEIAPELIPEVGASAAAYSNGAHGVAAVETLEPGHEPAVEQTHEAAQQPEHEVARHD